MIEVIMIWEGININLKATNMGLTDAITDYVIKRVSNLGRLLQNIQQAGGAVVINFEVDKTTNHHKNGQIFRAECNITVNGKQYYAEFKDENLYAAIDGVKDIILRDLKKDREKKQALYKRGAKMMKDALRGLTNWKKLKFWKK